jgi:hypothetical protein
MPIANRQRGVALVRTNEKHYGCTGGDASLTVGGSTGTMLDDIMFGKRGEWQKKELKRNR